MSETSGFKLKIPPAVTKYVAPDAPKEIKMMAAKGLVPLAPPILASILAFFLKDADPEVHAAAKDSLMAMPDGMVTKLVSEEVHPKALDFFAHEKITQEPIIEGIILNKITYDDTIAFLAETVSEKLATIIGNNQVRLMRAPVIVQNLRKNTNALKSEVDRVVSFLRINGIVVEGEQVELTHQEIQEIINAEDAKLDVGLPEELVKEADESSPANTGTTEEKRKNLTQMLTEMTVAQKVKLALKGNKEARTTLIKDSNKIVATSVIKSPRITDGEVIAIAQMRSVHDDIIRIIASNPEWGKNYNLQCALVNNPKTPFPIALKISRTLRTPDLEKLSKNKNVPGQLSKLAKEMWLQKRK